MPRAAPPAVPESSAALAAGDLGPLLQHAVEEVARLLRADGGMIYLVDEQSGQLRLTHDAGISSTARAETMRGLTLPVGAGMFGKAFLDRRVQLTGDYAADTAFPHTPAADRVVREVGIRSMVVAPLVDGDVTLGALGAFADRVDAFDEADVALVRALAEHAAAAMANRRLIDRLARSEAELAARADAERALREIAVALTALREPTAVLQRVVDEAGRLVGADGTILSLLDESGSELRWTYDDGLREGFDPEYVANLTLPIGVGPTGIAVAEARAIRVDRDLIDQFPAGPENDTFFETTGFRSMVTVPIVADAAPLGALEVYSSRAAGFSEADEHLLEALASQAAVALTNARLIEELATSRAENAARADRERALREIAGRLTAIREPGEVLQQIVTDGTRLLGAELGRIDLVEPVGERRQWLHPLTYPVPPDADDLSSDAGRSSGLSGLAIRARAGVTTRDYVADESFAHTPEADEFVRSVGIRAAIAAPLEGEDGLLGVLQAGSPRTDAFGAEHVALIEALADAASIAITNARLIDALETSRGELERRAESERAIREIAARLTVLREPNAVLVRVVEEARRLLGSDGAHLTLLAENGRFLEPVVVAGALDEETERWFRGLRFPVGTGINGLAAGRNALAWTIDYPRDPRIGEEAAQDFAKRLSIHGMAAAPLREPGGGVIGTLAISYATPHEVSPEDAAALQGLADHAAIAVANSRLLERVQASESRYRHLVQNSPDLVWSIDGDARFTFLSDTSERLTGWPPDELLGKHFGAIVHPDSREVATRNWTSGLADGAQELRGRVDLLHRDGRAIPAEFNAQVRVEDGRFLGANGSVRDMTDRDRLERQLRASEERHRYLVTASPDLTWEVDANAVFTFVSDRIAELAGYRPEEIVGRRFDALLHASTLDEARAHYAQLVAEPGVVHPARFSIRHRDGHAVAIENFGVGVVREGAFVGAHGAARDVTERDRLESGLRRQAAELAASEERAHLARELHDSVTQALFSMTLITRSIELLMTKDPEAARERLTALRDLQRDALAEMRSLVFELRPGSLEQDGLVVALRTHGAAIEGRIGLPILIDAEPIERLPIEVEDALYRIAQEALHNVVRHASARQVRISLGRTDGVVALRIEDDGRGFDPSAVPAGHLGVAGMHARAERVGARLVVDSAPGHGTRVEVTVPAAATAPGRRAPAALAAS